MEGKQAYCIKVLPNPNTPSNAILKAANMGRGIRDEERFKRSSGDAARSWIVI
jgi:hypothetical protein